MSARRAVSMLLLLALAVAACAPAATPLPTGIPAPTATATPAATAAPTATPAVATAPAGPPALVLVNGTLIDGTGSDPLADAVLVIQGDRVVAVGPRQAVAIPASAQVVDVQGATILPGIINAHVHDGYYLEKLAAWAQAGVTTVRDLNRSTIPPQFTARDTAEHDARYARLVAAGPFITAPDGYPTAVFGGLALYVSTPEEARRAVNDLLDQGADVIKISLESGQIFSQTIPIPASETVAAILETAHQRGTRVVAHVTTSRDLRRALNDGVDDITHMVVDDLPDELIQRAVAQGVYWEPTLELWKGVGHGRDRLTVENLRRYVAAGGLVALGTDYAGYSTPFQLGMPIIEMEQMQAAGMSPMQIIVAGTHNAARVCNRGQDLGTLEVGKIADVLVVQGDPLQDIHALGEARWVIHNGVVIRSP